MFRANVPLGLQAPEIFGIIEFAESCGDEPYPALSAQRCNQLGRASQKLRGAQAAWPSANVAVHSRHVLKPPIRAKRKSPEQRHLASRPGSSVLIPCFAYGAIGMILLFLIHLDLVAM
jgi:hypothetical protein